MTTVSTREDDNKIFWLCRWARECMYFKSLSSQKKNADRDHHSTLWPFGSQGAGRGVRAALWIGIRSNTHIRAICFGLLFTTRRGICPSGRDFTIIVQQKSLTAHMFLIVSVSHLTKRLNSSFKIILCSFLINAFWLNAPTLTSCEW